MPAIESIQSGSETIQLADGTSHDVTVTSVTTSRSVVLVTYRSANATGSRYLRHLFIASLTGATTLNFTRNSASFATDVVAEWTVIEFAAGEIQSLQVGSADCTADPTDVTISGVTLADAIPIFNGLTTDQTNLFTDEHNGAVFLSSTTNLRVDFAATPGAGDFVVGWQVLEFNSDDVTIQSGSITLVGVEGGEEGTKTATISAVDLSKTLVNNCGALISGGQTSLGGDARQLVRLHLTDATTLHAQRSLAGTTPGLQVYYDVVEFDDHTTIESGTDTIDDAATSENPTFTELGADSAVWPSHYIGNACNPNSVSDPTSLQDYQPSIRLGSPPDDVTLQRVGTDEDLEIAWFVADFTEGGGGGTHFGALVNSSILKSKLRGLAA